MLEAMQRFKHLMSNVKQLKRRVTMEKVRKSFKALMSNVKLIKRRPNNGKIKSFKALMSNVKQKKLL